MEGMIELESHYLHATPGVIVQAAIISDETSRWKAMVIFTVEGFNSHYTNLINLNTNRETGIVVLDNDATWNMVWCHTLNITAKYDEPESNQGSGASFHL